MRQRLHGGSVTTKEYLSARKEKNWKFNSIVDKNSFCEVNRIHPIKQKMVSEIVKAARNDAEVLKIIIFGSSIRYDCDVTSDLDICIDWKDDCYDEDGVLRPFTGNMRSVTSSVTKGRADVVNYDYLTGTAVETAEREGVVVYEHDV